MKIDKDMGSILGPELKIDGDVSVSGSLLIYGTVNGSISGANIPAVPFPQETTTFIFFFNLFLDKCLMYLAL